MGHRNADGTWHDSCLEKIKPGEPFFVMRAQDLTAPEHVENWAKLAEEFGASSAKVEEAQATAKAMREWDGDKKYPD